MRRQRVVRRIRDRVLGTEKKSNRRGGVYKEFDKGRE